MSAESFSVGAVIREELAASANPDPRAVVDAVIKRIPQQHRAGVLRYLIGEQCRLVASHQRQAALQGPQGRPKSWKVSAIREAGVLGQRVKVDGDHKFIGDCTVEDFLWLAEDRRRISAENEAWARRFDAFAQMLKDRGVSTLRDLPADVVEAVDAA